MDSTATEAGPVPAVLQSAFHVGIIPPGRPNEAVEQPDPLPVLERALSALASRQRDRRPADDTGREDSPAPAVVLRCIVFDPQHNAKPIATIAAGVGWTCVALEIAKDESSPGIVDAIVIESDPGHEADDRLALQTVFLDQSDLVIDLDEGGRSFGRAALLRAAKTAGIPVVSARDAATLPDTFQQGAAAVPGHSRGTYDEFREARSLLASTGPDAIGLRTVRGGPGPAADAEARLAKILARADEVAGLFGRRSRAVGMLRILLGAVASLGVFFAFYFADVVQTFWVTGEPGGRRDFHIVEALGYTIDVCAIAVVLGLSAMAKRRSWYSRFAAARYVAEHVRHMPAMMALGMTALRLRPGRSEAADGPSWSLHALARSFGCPARRITAKDRVAIRRSFDALVADQIRFYESRARRFDRLAHRLSRLANACFALGLVAVMARLSVFVRFEGATKLRVAAALGTFLFPALASIFVALRTQGEYARLSQRYAAVRASLSEALTAEGAEDCFASLVAYVRGTVAIMLAEVVEWRVMTKSQTIAQI